MITFAQHLAEKEHELEHTSERFEAVMVFAHELEHKSERFEVVIVIEHELGFGEVEHKLERVTEQGFYGEYERGRLVRSGLVQFLYEH